MSATSKIEWCTASWNPVRGCTPNIRRLPQVLRRTFAERFRGVKGHPYERGFDLRLVPEHLADPLKWAKPQTIFVNSMSDLFHKDIPDDYLDRVCWVMERANWHTYQVLTKRSERMRDFLAARPGVAALPNVWWGVSVENRKHGLSRIGHLRATPVTTRFLSAEPLLEDLGDLNLTDIHLVIVGGESGHGARPIAGAWVRSIRSQCEVAGIAFFFKQWGGRNKKATGRLLDGRTYDDMPTRTSLPVLSRDERNGFILELEAMYCE